MTNPQHVQPPVARAFENVRKLLARDSVFILTAPFTHDADTIEHFPELQEWTLAYA